MELVYEKCAESKLAQAVDFYMECYNSEGGAWTHEKAFKRIHQIASMDDSLILLQKEGAEPAGLLMGYFKTFDDCTGFYVEEIVIHPKHRNQGYGSALMQHLKEQLCLEDCSWIELLTTTQPQHSRFYGKNGYTRSDRLVLQYLDLK